MNLRRLIWKIRRKFKPEFISSYPGRFVYLADKDIEIVTIDATNGTSSSIKLRPKDALILTVTGDENGRITLTHGNDLNNWDREIV